MVLAMREGVLPKTLHVDQPSSKVDWDSGEIELLSEAEPWQSNGAPRRAGVSSFGVSGTNAHLILEERPAPAQSQGEGQGGGKAATEDGSTTPLPGPIPLTLSAKTEPALQEAAARLAAQLRADPELEPLDVAYSLATTRSAFEHRAVALGEDREQLLAVLTSLSEGADTRPCSRAGQRPSSAPSSSSPARAPSTPRWPWGCSIPHQPSPATSSSASRHSPPTSSGPCRRSCAKSRAAGLIASTSSSPPSSR